MESNLKITLKDFVYISTLSDLGITCSEYGSCMLKLDVSPGDYGFLEFHEGYLIAKYGYYPDFKDVIRIFNTRDEDKGLSGTYYGGDSNNQDHMRLFNECFRFHLHEDYIIRLYDVHYQYDSEEDRYDLIWSEESDSESEELDSTDSGNENDVVKPAEDSIRAKKLKELKDYHNLPLLFYLNQSLNEDDLGQLSLMFPMDKKIGNVQRVWRVVHDVFGDIGVAVLQKEFYNFVGDQAGLAFFATNTAQAFGNFNDDNVDTSDIYKFRDEPFYQFNCKFNPCNCDWRYHTKRENNSRIFYEKLFMHKTK